MASMNIALGPEQRVALPFFKGVAIDDTVSDFVQKYQLPAEEARQLLASVQKRLQDNGLAPLMEVSFNISGRKAVLPLYSGQNVTEQVSMPAVHLHIVKRRVSHKRTPLCHIVQPHL